MKKSRRNRGVEVIGRFEVRGFREFLTIDGLNIAGRLAGNAEFK
jgi:hypothetical protein